MKKIAFILVMVTMLFTFTSCVTSAMAYGINGYDNDVVVVDNVCYVYYTNPTTAFLNTLHIIDGSYYYWYSNRYVPVIFPRWEVWSPHRFFYYKRGSWMWRNRHQNYNHFEYRRTQHWVDHRRPSVRPHQSTPHFNNRYVPNKSNGSGFRPSSTRTTVNHGNFNRGIRPQHGGRR